MPQNEAEFCICYDFIYVAGKMHTPFNILNSSGSAIDLELIFHILLYQIARLILYQIARFRIKI